MFEMIEKDFKCVEDFCDEMLKSYYNVLAVNKDTYVEIIARYDNAKNIIRCLIADGLNLAGLEIDKPENNGYDAEYIIEIFGDELFCQPAKYNDKYLDIDGDITYIVEYCSSKILKSISSMVVYDVVINSKDEYDESELECCGDCDACPNNTQKTEPKNNIDEKKFFDLYVEKVKPHNFKKFAAVPGVSKKAAPEVKKTEKYTVNGKEVSKDVYVKNIKEIEKKMQQWDDHFTSVIQDSLLSMCNFRDMQNQMLADIKKMLM
ncbi:MAG: hypothetical protein HUJ63_02095 [Enterococcus sp.]|nr:hypothetical protein [Enterococcus sp.]